MLDVERKAASQFHTLISVLKELFRGQRQTEPDEEVALTGMRRGTKFVAEESFKSTDVLEVWFSGCHSGQFKSCNTSFQGSRTFQTLVEEMFRMMLRCLLRRSRCIG